jgi:hypothetical protein
MLLTCNAEVPYDDRQSEPEGMAAAAGPSGTGKGVLQLGWSHFWLLIGILGGMLGLVVMVFSAYLSSL